MTIQVNSPDCLTSKETVKELARTALATFDEIDQQKEMAFVIGVDTRLRLVYLDVVSIGILNSALLHPREVYRRAVITGVYGIFLVHNHPSGETDPSDEDLQISEVLKQAGKILQIELIDSLII